MTIGEYLVMLTDAVGKDPDLAAKDLYSEEGIPFGYEDHEDTARRFGVSEFMVRVLINQGLIEGVKSNDHIIVPVTAQLPDPVTLPRLLPEEYENEYSGLLSEQ